MDNLIYRQMIEESPIAYFSAKIIRGDNKKTKGLKIEECNKSFEQLFNVESEQLISKEVSNFLPKNQLKRLYDAVDESLINKKHSIESYLRSINLNCKIDIYYDDGDHVFIRIIKIDQTVLKLNKLIRQAPFIAWLKDKDGRYRDVNEKFLEIEKVDYHGIVGNTDHYHMSAKRANEYQAQDKEVLKENKMYTYKNIEHYADKTRYYEITKWPHIDENTNMVVGTMGIAIEKTNEIILNKELEQNQEIFSQIVNNIEDVISIRDENKFIYISPSFENMYGVKPEEINLYEDANGWCKIWNNTDYKNTIEDYYYCKKTSTSLVNTSLLGSGKEKWIYTKFVPILDDNENVKSQITIASDVTKLKEMEEEIEQLRLDFFTNLSHELRTPINLVLSSLQVLDLKMDKIDEEYFEYFNKYLNIIRQNGFRLLKLVNNLIDTTKINSGNFSYNPQNKDIISCVEDICMSVSEFIKNNDSNLLFDTNVEEKIISFDQDNIERIILNLLSNAIKFNKKNGIIEVSIICEDDVKIKVKDSGIGIPEDKLESVFGRYEQVKSNLKNEKEGSGIGLYLVKSLVEMHNGTITVKSKLGEGSEFIITLPDVLKEKSDNDILLEDDVPKNINNMNVEFSDIYV